MNGKVEWGEILYCRKCHKQSPDNFVTCAYCGAKLKTEKKKEPSAFVKKEKVKINISLKHTVIVLIALALFISLCAIVTALITGSKPEKVVKNFTRSIQTVDEELYYSLYDDAIKEYKKENRYYGEEETFENMVSVVAESNEFYVEKCGEGYELSYVINSYNTLDETELENFKKVLESEFFYVELPNRVDMLNVEITATGENGEYITVYSDFYCMKIKGKWYKVDKTIYTEYEKDITTS